jgi:GH25 family lysozyme M1 (1,4-beta-N-acetylmuramidase)
VTGPRGRWGRASIAVGALTIAAALATATTAPSSTTATHGIDVSSLNHPQNAVINWLVVAASGITFTAIKASEATYYVNPYFASDAAQHTSRGTVPGITGSANDQDYLSSPAGNPIALAQLRTLTSSR